MKEEKKEALEKTPKKINIGVIVIFVISLILIGCFVGGLVMLKMNKNETTTEETEEKETKKEEKNEYYDFLTNGFYLTTEPTPGGRAAAGYVFYIDGSFFYSGGSYLPRENKQVLAERGTWKLDGKKLVLTIEEEAVAIGEEMEKNPEEGEVLANFETKISETKRKKTFNIIGLTKLDYHECIDLGEELPYCVYTIDLVWQEKFANYSKDLFEYSLESVRDL